MRKIREVLRLAHDAGLSVRRIARSVGISRHAVTDYLSRAAAAGVGWPLPPDLDDAQLQARLFPPQQSGARSRKPEPNYLETHQAMRRKGATLQVLHEEFLAAHPDGVGYSLFCKRYRSVVRTLKPHLRRTYQAGDRVCVDYAGPTVPIVNLQTGEIRQAQIFVGVLACSNYTYAEAHWQQTIANWIAAHGRMFEFFEGVPALVICDNLKAAVLKASRTEPEVHPAYLEMAAHYGTAILPARPRKPQDKAKVETGVQVVERRILFRLRKRIFVSLGELNEAIRALLRDLNRQPFKKLPGCRLEAFERLDRPALRPLPSTRYEFADFRKGRVDLSYHVEIDRHYYSVPYILCRKEVEARLTATVVEILYGGRRVASHPRSDVPGGKTTNPEHMDPAHRHFAEWDQEEDLDWALTIGQYTHAFLQVVLAKVQHRDRGYRAAATMKALQREFGSERLEAACRRAMAFGATELRNVRLILRTGYDRQSAPEPSGSEADFDHENIRGAEYYQ